MLSPDPVTQAPENGQNYNRYTYAYNNPLKYSDPSGFYVTECLTTEPCRSIVSSVIASAFSFFGGGNGCDRTCQERKDAHNWCKAQSWCFELIQGSREKFRKRSALKILDAVLAGLDVTAVNRRGELTAQIPVVGQPITASDREAIFTSAMSQLGKAGLLDGYSVTFVNEFALAKLNKDGSIVKLETFGTLEEQEAFLNKNSGWDRVNGATLVGDSEITIYAGATMPRGGFIETSSGGLRPVDFDSIENASFVILHEIQHAAGVRSEAEANRKALIELQRLN